MITHDFHYRSVVVLCTEHLAQNVNLTLAFTTNIIAFTTEAS